MNALSTATHGEKPSEALEQRRKTSAQLQRLYDVGSTVPGRLALMAAGHGPDKLILERSESVHAYAQRLAALEDYCRAHGLTIARVSRTYVIKRFEADLFTWVTE